MSGSVLQGRGIRLARALALVLSAAIGVLAPGAALATQPPQPLRIVRPYRTNVSGTIFFSVRGIEPNARQVVFSLDGRRIRVAGRLAPGLRRAVTIDTRKLRNGRHVLALRVSYPGGRTAVAHKTIVVRNAHPAGAAGAHQASVGATPAESNASTPAGAGGTAGAGGSSTGAFGPPQGGAAGPSVVEFNRESYDYSTSWPLSEEADRYQLMVLSGNEYAEIPLLKAYNPNLKFLLYQAIWMTNRDDIATMPTATGCTAYADDTASHPDWFLHDQNGNLVPEAGHPDVYAMDVGNRAYQQECATNAAALAREYGFDGVFFDVVDGRLSDDVDSSISVPEYPTQTSWDNAMGSALAYLAPALRAQGLLVFGNVANTISVPTWEQWVGYLDGVEEESWTDGGEGLAQQIPFWSGKFTELNWAAANGKYEILHSYNGGEAANTFGLAAMLLGATGRASYATSNTNYNGEENWFPEYETALQLGAPAGSSTVLSNGVYERSFANGIVLVNPTGNSTPNFSLGGDAYSGSGLTNVQSVALGPTSGLILLKTG